jgi:hypothetical protein
VILHAGNVFFPISDDNYEMLAQNKRREETGMYNRMLRDAIRSHKAGCEIWNHDRLVTNVWVESDDGTQHHIIDQYGLV